MKLTQLTPCIVCNKSPLPLFRVIDVQLATADPLRTSQTVGIAQTWGPPTLATLKLAEVFAPAPEDAIILAGEENPELLTRLIVCNSCYMETFSKIAVYVEKAVRLEEELAQEGES